MAKVMRAIIVGGGIGGAATALSLARQGIKVMLLEKAHEIGEIGAGIQLGPNAFSALDSLGVGGVARQRAVFTDHITLMDAVNAQEVVHIETGQAFRDHFGGPYAVIHRADIHASGSRQRPPRRQRGQPVGETAADLECGSGAAPACDHRRALQRLPNLLSGAFVGRPRGGSALP